MTTAYAKRQLFLPGLRPLRRWFQAHAPGQDAMGHNPHQVVYHFCDSEDILLS